MIKLRAWWRNYKCRKDWHDYPDGTGVEKFSAWHFYEYTCRHCGKKFYI